MATTVPKGEARLVLSLYRSLLRVCNKYDTFALYKTTLINPKYTSSESLMTRGWTKNSVGTEILASTYRDSMNGLFYLPIWKEPISFVGICKKAFRNESFWSNPQRKDHAFEVCFGCLSELNNHIDKMQMEPNFIFRKVPPMKAQVRKALQPQRQNNSVFETVSDSLDEMKEDENHKEIKPALGNAPDDIPLTVLVTERPFINHLLVAHPLLAGTYFEKKVIRMEDGIQRKGSIIGKMDTVQMALSDDNDNEANIAKLLGDIPISKEEHRSEKMGDILEKITKQFNLLESRHSESSKRIARWYPIQLETEILEGKWLVVETNISQMLSFAKHTPCEQLWEYIVTRIGGEYELWKDYPTTQKEKQQPERKIGVIVL